MSERKHIPRITTALIPAAGQGKRLHPHTQHYPKCLIDVNGKPLLAHAIDALEANGFTRLVIITGHRHWQIDAFVEQFDTTMEIIAVYNDRYDSTNNIYTLWLASAWVQEPFLLLESDLIFDPDALSALCCPDRIALDRFDPRIHRGTTARITPDHLLASLNLTGPMGPADSLYKTVNMYSFSLPTWQKVQHAMKSRLDDGHLNVFYELAIRDLVHSGQIELEMADFSKLWWDEIDSTEDLARVNRHLAQVNRHLTQDNRHLTQDNRHLIRKNRYPAPVPDS